MKKPILILAVLLFLPFLVPPQARASTSFISTSGGQDNAVLNGQADGDAFIVGNTVSVVAPVGGELFGAGNVVNVTKLAGRSVYVAGNVVTLTQGSGYNTFAAGNTVTLSGTYGHDVYVAGNIVTISEGTVIDGDLRIAGSVVSIAGTVKGSVYASGNEVASTGKVGGTFSGTAGTLAFTGGSIGGDLSYQSAKVATGLDTISVTGKTQRADPPQPKRTPWYLGIIGWIVSLLTTFILASFLILLVPKQLALQVNEVQSDWKKGATVGIVWLIIMPIASIVAFATIIGWKIGLIVLAAYIILLLVSSVIAFLTLGQLILRRIGRGTSLWLSLIVGLGLVSVLGAIPWCGWLINAIFFIGLVIPSFGFLVSAMSTRDQIKG